MSSVEAPKILITPASPMPPPPMPRKVPKKRKVPRQDTTQKEASSSGSSPWQPNRNAMGNDATDSNYTSDHPTEIVKVAFSVATKTSVSTTSVAFKPSVEDCQRGAPHPVEREASDRLEYYCSTRDWKLKCLLLFDALLLPVLASAVYMGAAYIGKCRLNNSIQIILFIIGVSGFATAAYYLVMTFRKLYQESAQGNLVLWSGAVMTLLVTETMFMVVFVPTYEAGDFCKKTYVKLLEFHCLVAWAYLGIKRFVKYIRNARTTEISNVQ